ncbi:LrgB family protein [Virgibacillus xinjiangensis]|uniref:LrgB family protein n=1 Tax=Virgibacillus xinjiangensis TaxID=393090 RepID=A0ABV7CXC8_9BACI
MGNIFIGLIAFLATVTVYYLSLRIYWRWTYTFLAPVIPSTVFIVVFLLVFQIPYETYMIGGGWINWLLGPAVVALAYPLYEQRETLKRLTVPILTGTLTGAVAGVATGLLLAKWAGVDETIIYSLIPKNSTTPVAMEVAASAGGIRSLAAVFVMIAGIGGAMLHRLVLKYSGITDEAGKGVGVGSASHAIGTAIVMERSKMEGSVSTIAMVVSAVAVSVITPWFIMWLM